MNEAAVEVKAAEKNGSYWRSLPAVTPPHPQGLCKPSNPASGLRRFPFGVSLSEGL